VSKELWANVDRYLEERFLPDDPALDATLHESEAAGLDPIAVSPTQGKLLNLLVQMTGAKRVLEIGTLGGYSTICLARGLPEGGALVTLELDETHAAIARRNIDNAGVGEMVAIRIGAALDTLKGMAAAGEAPFDFVFIDADKEGYADYFQWVMKLTRKGAVIVADNVVRDGAVADPECTDPLVQGIRQFNDCVAAEPRVTATALQTLGSKGYDGLAIIRVTSD